MHATFIKMFGTQRTRERDIIVIIDVRSTFHNYNIRNVINIWKIIYG